jgi:hypothetical protein
MRLVTFIWALLVGFAQAPSVLLHMLEVAQVAPGTREVMLIQIDMNGDGRPDLLLGPSERFGNAGGPWHAYVRGDEPLPAFTYVGALEFHPFAYRFSPDTRTLSAAWRAGPDERRIGRFVIDRNEVRYVGGPNCELSRLTSACSVELDAIEKWQASAPPVLRRTFNEDNVPVTPWTETRTGAPVTTDVPEIHVARVFTRAR